MSQDLNQLCLEAFTHAEQGDINRAIECFSQALMQAPDDAYLHNNLANAYKKQGDFAKAEAYYQQAIQINPSYAQAYNNLGSLYASANDYLRALDCYRLAVHTAPDFTLAHYHLGLLFLNHEKKQPAITQFSNVVALNPTHLQAYFYLGVLYLDQNQLDEAEQAFEEVLFINSEHVDALINLGVIQLKRDHGQQAIDYFTKALALDHDNQDARNNLAATFIHHDRFENALTHYSVLLETYPNNIEYLYNIGVAKMALGHIQEAMIHFETLLKHNPNHFASLVNLAAIHTRLEKRDQASALLTKAHEINPDDPACQFMLNALQGHVKTDACPEYARHLFDNYALYYDQHLNQTLHYTLPDFIAEAIQKFLKTPSEHTLDLGCGTGLTGVVLRNVSNTLTGIDISKKMLKQAEKKNIYDTLMESELIQFLNNDLSQYHLIVSADVLPYVGELDTLFKLIHERLCAEGLFIFNIEISDNAPWQLQKNARFSHHPSYLQQLISHYHFKVLQQKRVTARQQSGQDVPVLLYVLELEPVS